jgi:DNA invertase Pin-like site-specific DNA recombinase
MTAGGEHAASDSLLDRLAFKELLAALYGAGIRTVVIEDVDRLGSPYR